MLRRLCNRALLRAPGLSKYSHNVHGYGYLFMTNRLVSFNAMDQTLHDLLINKYPEWKKSVRSKDGNLAFDGVDINGINVNIYTFHDPKLNAEMIAVSNPATNKEATYKIMDTTSPAWDADYIGEIPQIVERLANQTK